MSSLSKCLYINSCFFSSPYPLIKFRKGGYGEWAPSTPFDSWGECSLAFLEGPYNYLYLWSSRGQGEVRGVRIGQGS